jgi:DNA-binding response OmpR family regulator
MRILLAEDDNNISLIARIALEQLGHHQVTVANDGEKALQTALSGTFDLILLDEMMPKMNGLTVCREYQARVQTTPTPIIFLSAKSQETDIAEFRGCALGYIPKPFDPTQLCRRIDDLVKIQRTNKP